MDASALSADAKLRPVDRALGESCRAMADGAREALAWLADNDKLVGPARPGLERQLKRAVVEANRLGVAAVRPMSAAVFGPSQAGKSFLIGKFITPSGQSARVVFGGEGDRTHLDFLTEVNPQGGKETTGLVTRFSVAPLPTPPGFPVVLRLLRNIDLIKILANSFLFDLSGTYDLRETLSQQWVAQLIESLESAAGAETRGLSFEDVLELREYAQDCLPSHPFVQLPELAEAYWPALERLAPRLSGAARTRALSPLWGRIPEFDGLYVELSEALERLNYARTAYAPLSAIKDTAKGVLHVDRIYELSRSDGPGAEMVAVATDAGPGVTLRKSVITALTSELRVTLDRAPWPFLEHTDLLDFPGARSREDSTPEKYLRRKDLGAQDRPAREYCFLRGKVAVLFDNYVADLDLNTMMLCVPDGNLETRKLPALVEGWVAKTHGPRPDDRIDRPISLLFCMTKCDRLFDLSAGATLAQSIANRFDVNLKEFSSWMKEWRPGEPFRQIFMLRNPKAVEQQSLFRYDGAAMEGVVRTESALSDDLTTRILPSFRKALSDNPLARVHVADLDDKIDALLSLNDGGVAALAEALAPLSQPELKYGQIKPQATVLANELSMMLRRYYDEDDIVTRVETRRARAVAAFLAATRAPLGLLLQTLFIDEPPLRQVYFDVMRQDHRADDAPPARHDDHAGGFDLSVLGVDAAAPQAAAPPPRRTYGVAALERWVGGLMAKAVDNHTPQRFGLTPEHYQVLVEELDVGARRLGLAQRIDAEVDQILNLHQPPPVAAATVALAASLIVNDYISDAGRALTARSGDETLATAAAKLILTPQMLAVGQFPQLPDDKPAIDALRREPPTAWVKAFISLTVENASSSAGVLVDPVQNARLGGVLSRFTGSGGRS